MPLERNIFYCWDCHYSQENDNIQTLDIRTCPECGAKMWNFVKERDDRIGIQDRTGSKILFDNYLEAESVLKGFLEKIKEDEDAH